MRLFLLIYFHCRRSTVFSLPSGSMNLSICSHTHRKQTAKGKGERLCLCVCVSETVCVCVCVLNMRFLKGRVCSQFTWYKVWTRATRLQLPPRRCPTSPYFLDHTHTHTHTHTHPQGCSDSSPPTHTPTHAITQPFSFC